MTLRVKLVVALATLATVATVAVGLSSYRATGQRLRAEVDRSLETAAQAVTGRGGRPGDPDGDRALGMLGRAERAGAFELVTGQIIDSSGAVLWSPSGDAIFPVDDTDRAVAAGQRSSARHDVTAIATGDGDGEPYRVLTVPIRGGAVQLGRSLAENDRLLTAIRDRTLLFVALAMLGAAVLGWVIARQITRRLVHLTDAAEAVASTGRLDLEVPIDGGDETARLGTAFSRMLAALARSKEDQQRLVQDAGHELRTPLTSLRTNIAVLRRHQNLPPEQMGRLLDDLDGEARELTELVNELVELATDRRSDEPEEVVVLADVADRVVRRAQRRSPRSFTVDADASAVTGRPQALERALGNLVENAAKFDDAGAPVEVVIRGGRVDVLDRGPGIAPDDLPHLFDRFYRAVAARSRPGSGLGLSIVRDIVTAHRGAVHAENRSGGGACIGFTLPVETTTTSRSGADATSPPSDTVVADATTRWAPPSGPAHG